jgi:hypothetical protein
MKPFPYDEFYPIFMEEVKSLFSRFISHNKDKKPYIFTVCAPDHIADNQPNSYCLWANGNIIVNFESPKNILLAQISPELRNNINKLTSFESGADPLGEKIAKTFSKIVDSGSDGYSYANTTDGVALTYKYSANEWSNETFTNNDFPKSNSIILDYVTENEDKITDEDCNFTEEFMKFRTDFFNCLIESLKQLRDEKFFETVYPERILINFEVREYYEDDEMIRIFEYLNTQEEAELFAKFLIGSSPEYATEE